MKNSTVFTTIALLLLSCSAKLNAQGTAINNTGALADSSAGLDVDFNNKGFLIPRMTQAERNAIVSPAVGLQIFNTTTGCFNFYSGASWKQWCGDCDFSNPTAGNNGPICEGSTLNLTASFISGATYQWDGPNGFTSTDQNPVIANATSAASGSYSVRATKDDCTCQPQTTIVTVNAIPNPPICGNNGPITMCGSTLELTASLIVGATYSWTGPNSFTSNAQNPTIPNPQQINAGTYNVTATVNGCSSPAANTNVTVNNYVAITLTNNQTSATATGFQQQITINSSNYSANELSGLENILFSTDACNPGGAGTVLKAWCESGCSDVSSSTVWWVNLGTNNIAGSGGTKTIYMNFMSSAVMANSTSATGKAPELTTPYSQYDNGALVFACYDNFAGTVVNPTTYNTENPSGSSISQNNGITVSTTSASYGGLIHTSGFASSPPQIFDGKVTSVSGVAAGMALQTGNTGTSNSIDFNYWSGSVGAGSMNNGMSANNNPNLQISTGIMGGVWLASSSQVWYKNYSATAGTINNYSLPSTVYPSLGIFNTSPNSSISFQWIRAHLYPPEGVMPAVSY